jgi:hypothetical protein
MIYNQKYSYPGFIESGTAPPSSITLHYMTSNPSALISTDNSKLKLLTSLSNPKMAKPRQKKSLVSKSLGQQFKPFLALRSR